MNRRNLIVLLMVLGSLSVENNARATDLDNGFLAGIEACNPTRIARASPGYICHAGNNLWRVQYESYAGRPVYRDMSSGMSVTEPLDGTSNQAGAATGRCAHGYQLPSGYPATQMGHLGTPNVESEFSILEADGIRQVVPHLRGHMFWSSSFEFDNTAYVFNGNYGATEFGQRDSVYVYNDDTVATLCIRGR